MAKITKRNWKCIVKQLKKQNKKIYTYTGGKVKARQAKFCLRKIPSGKYTIIAKRK